MQNVHHASQLQSINGENPAQGQSRVSRYRLIWGGVDIFHALMVMSAIGGNVVTMENSMEIL